MRELNNTEIETVAGGHRGDLGHAAGEAIGAYLKTRNIKIAVVTFFEHYAG